MKGDILIDTHILIWLADGDSSKISPKIKNIIENVFQRRFIYVSAISLLEISRLAKRNRVHLSVPIHEWIKQILSFPDFKIIDLDYKIAVESYNLPGEFHADPADRIIVATARVHNIPLITMDRQMLDYAQKGFVRVLD